MKLTHIVGNTYVVETNMVSVGIYIFEDQQQCLLIDSGANPTQAEEIFNILSANGWGIYAIFNTHSHADHCGATTIYKAKVSVKYMLPPLKLLLLKIRFLIPYSMYSAYPLKLLTGKFLMPQPSTVTNIISSNLS